LLFNSYFFILIFLPIVLIGYYFFLIRKVRKFAINWLVFSSLFFYTWWNPIYVFLLIFSILVNFIFGSILSHNRSYLIVSFGVLFNILLLGYFKYVNFFVDNLNILFSASYTIEIIILPLAISFFTFQQIAYLVDSYKGEVKNCDLNQYFLFVLFFPQLIAGPIVHHKEMLPQFLKDIDFSETSKNIAIGCSFFSVGLFKKVVIADGLSHYVTPVFASVSDGQIITFFEAWFAAVSYTFQLYFDFSGYSDMAIGIAFMFGIKLPINFNSPYKATSIIDFWRTWHITLSRFLRDYIYIPLGGNKNGNFRTFSNLMTTFLIGGFWHGAGWTFVIWGFMHGVFLIINHAWRNIYKSRYQGGIYKFLSWFLTITAVVFSWVMFRSDTYSTAFSMYSAMLGLNGIYLPSNYVTHLDFNAISFLIDIKFIDLKHFYGFTQFIVLVLLFLLVTYFPNSNDLINNIFYNKANSTYKKQLIPATLFAPIYFGLLFSLSFLGLNRVTEFLYFQF